MWDVAGIETAQGLTAEERRALETLLDVGGRVEARNARLRRYYDGDVEPRCIGVEAIPDGVRVHESCDWARKAVTSVAERSRFDGFVLENGGVDRTLQTVERNCHIGGQYERYAPSELVHGCMFATVGLGEGGGAYVRFYSADQAAATWDYARGRVESGLVLSDMARTRWSPTRPQPVQVNMHLPGMVVEITRVGAAKWTAVERPQAIDRPMMESFAYRATGLRPFGESRITRAVMDITDDVLRTLQNMAVSSAFYAAPQKYLLGLTDEQFDQIQADKWSTYIGSMLLTTRDDDGNTPSFGQIAAASPQPYIDLLRTYAMMFSAATGVPLNSLGIVQDNPSSAEAIQAAREDICICAESLNESSAESLRNVALMAMAVEAGGVDRLDDNQMSVMARFKDPSKPSIVSQAAAYVQVAAVDEGFAGTDVFYEGLGFDAATRARIRSEKQRGEAMSNIRELLALGEGDGE